MKRFNALPLIAGAFALSIGGVIGASAQQPSTETPAPAATPMSAAPAPAPPPAPAAAPSTATVVQTPAPAAAVTQAMLNSAATDRRNFLATNGDYKQQRFFPNNDINRSNIKRLHVAWIFQTDIQEFDGDFADRRQRRDVCHDVV